MKFILMSALASTGILSSLGAPLGQFDGHLDIGSPKLAGSAGYDPATQEYALSSAGTNMWFSGDECHFAWKRLTGDFVVRARVQFLGQGADPHRKLGWMARASLEPDSPYADTARHGDGLTSLQFRRAKGAATEQVVSAITNADVVQLARQGNTYTFSAARYGEPFAACQVSNLDLGEQPFVGLFLCSHNGDVVEKAVFRDVRLIRPAKADFVPYHDYIGSVLEILDIPSGHSQIIHQSAQPFEAPNWTPDGSALIYNSSGGTDSRGRLYRFDLTQQQPVLINTEFANRNNNDHVLSFDGKLLGISHHSPDHAGQSAVFTVPVQGGTPKLITPLAPSYLHGWSPDGRFLVYTGGRNGVFNIYRIPAAGGQEIRLTDAKALDDGPEYTPDGKYIYFNSTRSGTMQLWRMKSDGSSQEQVTNDEFNNWFPHISPDGKWIAFVSYYTKDMAPADHPYYKHVYLRLMPIAGGAPKIIAYLYGGQGTMNVPSWAPDSRRLAFVSNTTMD